MPNVNQLAHRNITSTAIPYRSNISPTDTTPSYVSGSSDVITSINGYTERRPGFSLNVEPTPTTFNNMQRLFTWDRFDGTFIEMACDVNSSNQAVVYKRIIGVDNSFVSIFTDTGSANLFDFVVSNNTVYFSNGHVAKAWDPVNGIRNWGIAIGAVSSSVGPNTATAGADGGGGHVIWTNPGNVTSAVSFATASVNSLQTTNPLQGTTFGFSLTGTNTVLGIQVSFVAGFTFSTAPNLTATVQLLKAGVAVGTAKMQTVTGNAGNLTFTLGGSSDLWGATWTANDINQSNFGFQITVNGTGSGVNHANWSINDYQVTIFDLGGPAISVSGSAGTFSATVGYQYVFCYGNSNTGHISSPSPTSVSTGVFTSKLNVQVTLTASTDPQVNQIRVFRSTDSVATGTTAGTFFEIPTSPFPNSNANITDNAADSNLNISSIAPFPGFNDPPTPGQSIAYYSGRVWMLSNNKVVFSGLEEIINGVPEESFPSGPAGNFWNFDQPVQGLAIAGSMLSQTLGIFCGGRLYGITGNSLDTFRRFLVSNRRGCRNLNAMSSLGGMVAWFDSSSTIWVTDGNTLQEISLDIRPDLVSLSPSGANFTFHVSGRFHWLVCAFPSKTFIYDLDLSQWLPPWNISSKAMYSGETSPGNYQLMLSNGTKALILNQAGTVGSFNDNGVTYSPVLRTANHAVVPDFGKRFSYASQGLYDQPSKTGMGWYIQGDTNSSSTFSDVSILVDDDPLNSSSVYKSITINKVTPLVAWNRNQGANLVQNIYSMNGPVGRWYAIKFTLPSADQVDNIYDYFLAYEERK